MPEALFVELDEEGLGAEVAGDEGALHVGALVVLYLYILVDSSAFARVVYHPS